MEDGQEQHQPMAETTLGSSDHLRRLIREEIAAALPGPSTSTLPATSETQSGEKRG